MKGNVLQISPVLAEDTRQQTIALDEAKMLGRLVTSWAPVKGEAEAFWSLPGLRKICRRSIPVRADVVTRVYTADLVERASRLLGSSPVDAVDRRFACVDRVAKRMARAPIRIVFGREDGCLNSFRYAKSRGFQCIYDLPTAHHKIIRRLIEREVAQFPGVDAISADPRDFSEDRTQRKDQEVALADAILCPSDFVRNSLLDADVEPHKIHVLPFAAEPDWLKLTSRAPRMPVFLHVGQISLRKGVHRLLIAWKRLRAYRTHQLRLIGSMRLSPLFLRDYAGMYEHVPAVPRHLLPLQYLQAQALVLNSLGEGFAMIIPEALSCGTAVLLSRNTGAENIVADGREGRLFDFGDDDQFTAVLDWALSHPDELEKLGQSAWETAATWTWPQYRREFSDWMGSFVKKADAP